MLGNEKEKLKNMITAIITGSSDKPEYANILRAGSIEAVTLANNHTYDYGQAGVRCYLQCAR